MKYKERIKGHIAANRTKSAINEMLQLTRTTDFYNEVILQSSKFKHYQKAKRLASQSSEDLDTMLDQIHFALLDILEQLEDDVKVFPFWSLRSWPLLLGVATLFLGTLVAETTGFIDLISTTPTLPNSVTVLVRSDKRSDEVVLPNRGKVTLIYGSAIVTKQISNEGEANFNQIPGLFFEKDALVKMHFNDPEGEPYRAVFPDSVYQLKRAETVELVIELAGTESIHGIVKDFETGNPIDSAIVRVQGLKTYTNTYGEFVLNFPEEKRRKFVKIRVFKDGYQTYELNNVPTITDQAIELMLKK